MTTREHDDVDELASLRTEREQLQSQLTALTDRRHQRSRLRSLAAPVLAVLACVCLVAATIGVWANRNLLDTDRFVTRVGPLIEEPEVQDAVAARITEQVVALVDIR